NAGAVEAAEVVDRQHSRLRAGGDDDRARRDVSSVLDLDHIRPPFAVQMNRRFRDHHLRAEFLRLTESARGKLLTGNPRWKTEVVLDVRARGGLSTRRIRFDHENVQTF